MKKKVLFATGNESKLKRFQKGLSENNIKLVSLKDLNNYDFRPQILIKILQNDNKVFDHLIYKN